MLDKYLRKLNDYVDSLAIFGLNIVKSQDILRLDELIDEGNKIGLENLVKELKKLKEILSKKIHSTEDVREELYDQFVLVCSYLYIEMSMV